MFELSLEPTEFCCWATHAARLRGCEALARTVLGSAKRDINDLESLMPLCAIDFLANLNYDISKKGNTI